jgi:hypothetical protein
MSERAVDHESAVEGLTGNRGLGALALIMAWRWHSLCVTRRLLNVCDIRVMDPSESLVRRVRFETVYPVINRTRRGPVRSFRSLDT